MSETLYEVLGVNESASSQEIRRAYRRLAREHHPDTGGDEERFKSIAFAFEVLSDHGRRSAYDQQLSASASQPSSGWSGSFDAFVSSEAWQAFFSEESAHFTAKGPKSWPRRTGWFLEDMVGAGFENVGYFFDWLAEKVADAWDFACDKAADGWDFVCDKATDAADFVADRRYASLAAALGFCAIVAVLIVLLV